jgi:putative Holliday junction resolvase
MEYSETQDGQLPEGKLMALDVGLARIGIAVCDPLRLAARPLTVIERKSRRDDFTRLAQLAADEEIVAVICGLPLSMDGTEADWTRTVRKWAKRLAYALRSLLGRPVPIIFWDERLTTFAANEILADLGAHDIAEDAAAAAVILQYYLDALERGDVTDFGRIDLPPKTEG